MDKQLLEKLAIEVQHEWQVGGLFDGIYRDFFMELLARYEAAQQSVQVTEDATPDAMETFGDRHPQPKRAL